MSLIEVARDEIFSQLARAERRVHIASPFLSADVAAALVQQARVGRASQLRMLTALTERSVIGGALDPHALGALIQGGWAVASIPNLHAKAALVDGTWGLVGSGNLTTAGLGARGGSRGNVELGVVLTRAQARAAAAIFDRWWEVAEPVTEANLAPFLGIESVQILRRSNRRVGNAIPVGIGRTLERLERRRASNRSSWIKAMYHDPRKDRPGWWRKRTWINDRHVEVAGRPTRRPGYAVGDLVALYLVEPGVLAALYEVTGTPEFDPSTVAAERAVDGERYGWVTPVEVVAAAELDEAPRLAEFGIDGRSLQNGRKFVEDRQLWRRIERRLSAS